MKPDRHNDFFLKFLTFCVRFSGCKTFVLWARIIRTAGNQNIVVGRGIFPKKYETNRFRLSPLRDELGQARALFRFVNYYIVFLVLFFVWFFCL